MYLSLPLVRSLFAIFAGKGARDWERGQALPQWDLFSAALWAGFYSNTGQGWASLTS